MREGSPGHQPATRGSANAINSTGRTCWTTSAQYPHPQIASTSATARPVIWAPISTDDSDTNRKSRFRCARNCVEKPFSRKVGARAIATATSRGSAYSAEIGTARAAHARLSSAPMPRLIQNSVERCPCERVFAWIAALDKPKSRTISPTPTIASTIAVTP